ncbi:MAG: S24 family peptidase, partial [Cetobacterium sp.]
NRSQLSEDILSILKEIMPITQFEELEQAFYFEKMPEKLRNLIQPNKIKIPYFENINASAGTGILNFCEMNTQNFLEIENKYNNKKCVAINIVGESMWPELQDSDIVIIDCSNRAPSIRGYFVVKYGDEIFAKKLIMSDGNVVGLKSVNPMYKDVEIDLNNNSFEIIGRIESVYREFF